LEILYVAIYTDSLPAREAGGRLVTNLKHGAQEEVKDGGDAFSSQFL
jgi:hypothetical protein